MLAVELDFDKKYLEMIHFLWYFSAAYKFLCDYFAEALHF